MSETVVFDASVGVKWFKLEPESEQAWALLARHAEGELSIIMPEHCIGEVLAVAARRIEPSEAIRAWVSFAMAGVEPRRLDDYLVRESVRQSVLLGCDFYDALAPALAVLLKAPLYSADRRAHSRFEGVRFLGE